MVISWTTSLSNCDSENTRKRDEEERVRKVKGKFVYGGVVLKFCCL
jgi:hypothetical protein